MKFWNPWKPVENANQGTKNTADQNTDGSTDTTEKKATCPFSTSPSKTNDVSAEAASDSKKME